MSKTFLDKAYSARDTASTRQMYDAWSTSYEAEIKHNGYATPGRCALALARFLTDTSAPVLDFGCGTGLSGFALKGVGFERIDGVDLSCEMLAQAGDKNIYRSLAQIEGGAPLTHAAGDYAAITAVGVIGTGAAPVSTFDILMSGLARGGLFVFSFNDHALQHPEFEGRVSEWTDCGAARLLFREHGPHLPGQNLGANVYVLEKT